jgi:Acetyltransferase (GNAT) domain
MEIIQSSVIDPIEWAELLAASDDVWLYHTHQWIESTARTFSLTNHYLVARENRRNVGALPLQLSPAWRLGQPRHVVHSTMMGPAGPFCIRDIGDKQRNTIWSELTSAAAKWAGSQGAETVRCALPPLAAANLDIRSGVNPLVLCGWHDESTHTHVADLTIAEDELFKNLSKGAKACIKKSNQEGVSVERVEWRSMLDEYYKLHVETYARTGVVPFPRTYFELIADLGWQGHAVLWVCKNSTGSPIAFHNCARFRDTSLYWTGCSAASALTAGANHLLFWKALLGAKQDGCRSYEIGEVFPEAQKGKLKGLTDFKKMFGGLPRRSYRGEIELRKPSLLRTYWRILKQRVKERRSS